MIDRRTFAVWGALAALALASGLSAHADDAAGSAPAGSSAPAAPNPQVRVTTGMGSITIELYPDRAPLTVANFLRYVKDGQYTQTIFHRVIPNFLIQGGGFATDNSIKPTHPSIVNESGNGLQNKRGWVGLARTPAPHSGNSQFYINVADNPELDPLPVRWGYAVFGKVIDGMDVVDRIATVGTGAVGPFKADAPLSQVVIQKIEVIDAAAAAAATAPSSPPPLAPAPTGNEVLTPK